MKEYTEEQIERYKKKFEQVVTELELLEGETMVHCLDAISHNGSCYFPEWAITNKGRGYSLWKDEWLVPQAIGTKRAYWGFCAYGNRNPKAHQLVVNYFKDESDIVALEFFGENSVEIHHDLPIAIPDEIKTGTKEDRIAHCMKYNSKENLHYQEKLQDHVNVGRITRGHKTKEEEEGIEEWDNDVDLFRTLGANSTKSEGNEFGTRIIYSKDAAGNLIRKIKMRMKIKGEN